VKGLLNNSLQKNEICDKFLQKGHYMVVRGSTKTEAERWYQALLTHVNYKGNSLLHAYVRPQAIPKEPKLFKDIVVLDLGSSSVRAGILSTQGNSSFLLLLLLAKSNYNAFTQSITTW
jgi:hypothetical protein